MHVLGYTPRGVSKINSSCTTQKRPLLVLPFLLTCLRGHRGCGFLQPGSIPMLKNNTAKEQMNQFQLKLGIHSNSLSQTLPPVEICGGLHPSQCSKCAPSQCASTKLQELPLTGQHSVPGPFLGLQSSAVPEGALRNTRGLFSFSLFFPGCFLVPLTCLAALRGLFPGTCWEGAGRNPREPHLPGRASQTSRSKEQQAFHFIFFSTYFFFPFFFLICGF